MVSLICLWAMNTNLFNECRLKKNNIRTIKDRQLSLFATLIWAYDKADVMGSIGRGS